MKRRLLLLLVVLCSIARAQDDVPIESYGLSQVGVFAFGGIGSEAITSQGEKDFRIVFAQPPETALKTFEEIYSNGTPEARCYALVGIRELNRKQFKVLLELLRMSKSNVLTIEGSSADYRSLAEISQAIDSGYFDSWIEPLEQPQ